MSCLVTTGRKEPCKNALGGLYKIFVGNYDDISGYTFAEDGFTITGLTNKNIFEFELKGGNSFTQSLASSRDNGTTAVTQTLTVVLKNQSQKTHNEVMLLAYGRPKIIVQYNDGKAYLAGKDFGMELTTSEAVSGTVQGDLNGYTMTFVGVEAQYANELGGATLANVLAGFDGATETVPIIVKGN